MLSAYCYLSGSRLHAPSPTQLASVWRKNVLSWFGATRTVTDDNRVLIVSNTCWCFDSQGSMSGDFFLNRSALLGRGVSVAKNEFPVYPDNLRNTRRYFFLSGILNSAMAFVFAVCGFK